MKLYSSTFIGIVMAFLMFIGYNGQPVDVVENPSLPNFSNIHEMDVEITDEKVKVEIFDDLLCSSCTDFTKNTLPKIRNLDQETENLDLRLYFIPDINDEIYYMAALSLKCAADQDAFWTMHEKIHENKEDLNAKLFMEIGKELVLNTEALNECIKEDVHRKTIEDDVKYASEKQITFNPTLLIGKYKLIGNQPYENIQRIINITLKNLQKTPLSKPSGTDIEVLEVKELTEEQTPENGNSDADNEIPMPDIELEI
jgi:protein-disulfide isomerase